MFKGCHTENGRKRVKTQIEAMDFLMSMNRRRVPGLKVLSAMAVCTKYKDLLRSEQGVSSGVLDWRGNCKEPCQNYPDNIPCGFCRLENP